MLQSDSKRTFRTHLAAVLSLCAGTLSLALLLPTTGCSKKSPFADLDAEQSVPIAGLSGEVELLRDSYGVPHIYCKQDLDCIRAQGYVQAHDRFFEMDLFRNYGLGTLGRLFGANPAVRSVDRETRRLMSDRGDGRHVAEHIAETLDADTLEWLEAFASGINAYLSEMGKSPRAPIPDEYDFGLVLDGADAPRPWTPVDTLAIGRLFSMMLSNDLDVELPLSKMAAALDPQTFADLNPSAPLDPTFVMPDYYGSGSLGSRWKPSPRLHARLKKAQTVIDAAIASRRGPARLHRFFGREPGSNNWIISADKSATGNVLVADDPHLPLWSPAVWHEVQFDGVSLPGAEGTLEARGVAFPGTPGVIIGHNARIAWSVTTTGYDVSDLYQETVSGLDKVRFKGADVAVKRVSVKFPRGPLDSDGSDEEKICLVTQHGPLWASEGFTDKQLADPATPCVDPSKGATALSGRWTGMDPSNELAAFKGLLFAKNIQEAKSAWMHFQVGAQNLLVGDVDGGVLYFPYARLPIRDGDLAANPPWLPLPGEGGYEWLGDVPASELPQVENPVSGFVVTANNDIAGVTADDNPVNDTHYLFRTRNLGLRAGRITRLLKKAMAAGPVELEELRAIQTDTQSDFAAAFIPHLLKAAANRTDLVTRLGLGDAIARLQGWDFSQPTGLAEARLDAAPAADASVRDASIATSLFATWMYHAIDATFRDELDAAGVSVAKRFARPDENLQKAIFFALENSKDSYFDDVSTVGVVESRDEILLSSLKEALDELTMRLGQDPAEWLWGRLHSVSLQSIFGVFGLPNDFDLGPLPQPGGFHTINVANFDRDFVTTAGPSVRMLTDMITGQPSSEEIIPGGTIDQMGNPNRDDQLLPWLRGEYKVIPNRPDTVLEAATVREKAGLSPGAHWLFEPLTL